MSQLSITFSLVFVRVPVKICVFDQIYYVGSSLNFFFKHSTYYIPFITKIPNVPYFQILLFTSTHKVFSTGIDIFPN